MATAAARHPGRVPIENLFFSCVVFCGPWLSGFRRSLLALRIIRSAHPIFKRLLVPEFALLIRLQIADRRSEAPEIIEVPAPDDEVRFYTGDT